MDENTTLSFQAQGNDCARVWGRYPAELKAIYDYLVEQNVPARLADANNIVFDRPVKFTTVMAHYQNLSGRATLNWENLRQQASGHAS